jgi:protein-tyrosine phosphatase
LLSDKELEFLGSPWPDYKRSAETAGLKVIRYPIVEGEGPADMDQFERQVMQPLLSKTQAGQNVICHCRGGVGRAGLVACCWLMRLGVCKGPVEAIAMVRVRRSPRAIETIVQEDFIRRYYGAYCTA